MADKHDELNKRNCLDNNDTTHLESFIASHMQQQEKISKEQDNLDSTKRENFITRALAESRRMSLEVEKSHQKSEHLHAELGQERLARWRDEHSDQVLKEQDQQLKLS